jgi:putative hydroxymethylpyrimidine transporter CytX
MTEVLKTSAVEPPITLDEAPARTLGLTDQLVLWASLGVSLLLPVTGIFLLAPGMALGACLVAIVVGTVLGNLLLGAAAVPGADTGAPAMVLFRGLFGRRGSYIPTVLNLAQCIGWSTFEIIIIAESADRVVGGGWRWPFVVIAGTVATLMAIRPIAVVQVLKRYVFWLVIASTVYLFVQVLRHDLPGLTEGGWNGFWPAVDLVAALSVSWMPLAADYSRQSTSARASFVGASVGYAASSAPFFALGVLVVAGMGGDDVIGSLLAIPAGALALAILAIDEIDEAFANIYSTAVSGQNLAPRVDRRALAVGVGVVSTLLATVLDTTEYENFLYLLGSVFVPLFAVFIVDYYVLRRRRWDTSETAPGRWLMLVPWLVGFVTYQLIYPGHVGWWERWWRARQADLFTPPTWLGATITSFAVAALATVVVGYLTTRRGRRSGASAAPTA